MIKGDYKTGYGTFFLKLFQLWPIISAALSTTFGRIGSS